MIIELERPLVFFDVETTGTNILSDRIIQFSAIKIFGDTEQQLDILINPGRPINNSNIHGITDEMVADKGKFKQAAPIILEFIKDCDFGTFNGIKFDIPMLYEEMCSCGYSFDISNARLVDVFRLFQILRPRNLAACFKEFVGRDMVGAHNALYDTIATMLCWKGMIAKHEIAPSIEVQEQMYLQRNTMVDFAGCFIINDTGDIVFNFGKHKGKIAIEEKNYLSWMLQADFTAHTKYWTNKIYNEEVFYTKKAQQDQPTIQDNIDDDLPF